MAVRAIRGAIQLDVDEREHLLSSTRELVSEVLDCDELVLDCDVLVWEELVLELFVVLVPRVLGGPPMYEAEARGLPDFGMIRPSA